MNKKYKTLCPPRIYFLVRNTQMNKISKISDRLGDDKGLRRNKAGEEEDAMEG